MTAVVGHLTKTEFGPEYKNWFHPPPVSLFRAPILTSVADVRLTCFEKVSVVANILTRTRGTLRRTSKTRPSMPEPSSFGPIATEKGNILVARLEILPEEAILIFKLREPNLAISRERE